MKYVMPKSSYFQSFSATQFAIGEKTRAKSMCCFMYVRSKISKKYEDKLIVKRNNVHSTGVQKLINSLDLPTMLRSHTVRGASIPPDGFWKYYGFAGIGKRYRDSMKLLQST